MQSGWRLIVGTVLALFALVGGAAPASAAWEIDAAPGPSAWTW